MRYRFTIEVPGHPEEFREANTETQVGTVLFEILKRRGERRLSCADCRGRTSSYLTAAGTVAAVVTDWEVRV